MFWRVGLLGPINLDHSIDYTVESCFKVIDSNSMICLFLCDCVPPPSVMNIIMVSAGSSLLITDMFISMESQLFKKYTSIRCHL